MTFVFRLPILAVVVASLALASTGAFAQAADKTAEKAARRMQLQMQNLQQQLTEAQAATTKAEAAKAEVDKQLAEQTKQITQLKGSLRKSSDTLKTAETARAELATNLAALEKQSAEQKRTSDDTLAQKAKELAQYTKQRDEQQAQLQRKHDDQITLVGECTGKNEKLLRLSSELLDRYRSKGFNEVAKQKEPLLGLGDIATFNMLQDYRDKIDAERFTAPPPTAPPPPTSNR